MLLGVSVERSFFLLIGRAYGRDWKCFLMVQGNLLAAGVLPADSGSLLLVGDIVGSFGVAFLIGRYESGDGWFCGRTCPGRKSGSIHLCFER